MSKFTCLFGCVVGLLYSVSAFTEEDRTAFNNAVKPHITECAPLHGVTNEDLKAVKEAGTSAALPPCFFACVLKREKHFNDQGLFELDVVLNDLRQLIKNKDDLAHLEGAAKKCASVNEKAVSDGEAGCERAKMLFDCLRQNDAEIPL